MLLLPWLHNDLRKNPDGLKHLTDCRKCMETYGRETRQLMGCGWEPEVPGAKPWSPPKAKLGYRHDRPAICAGYLAKLPEVVEVGRAHTHWSKGQIAAFCGDERPSEMLLALVELLDGELEQVKVYAMTPTEEGGGRE